VIRLRAALFGRYFSDATAAATRARVSAPTGPLPFNARDTVATDTPACAATSLIVAAIGS
jgi:hypothetical protein